MLTYIKQNKNIFIVTLGLFIASMSALLFFLNDDHNLHEELKTNVVDSIALKSYQEEEKRYRDLLGNHEDPIIILNLDGTIDFVSWDFGVAAGYKQKELKGELFLGLLHPEDLGTFMSAFGKVIGTEEALTMIGPYRLRDSLGAYRVNMGSVYPIKEEKKVVKIGLTTRDISYEIEKSEEEKVVEEPAVIPKKKLQTEGAQTSDPIEPPASPPTPTKSHPSKKLSPLKKDEPTWITGNRLVMLFPF